MSDAAIALVDRIFESYPFNLRTNWPTEHGAHITNSLFASFGFTRQKILDGLVRKELSEDDRKALLPFAETYSDAFISLDLPVGHDTVDQPAFLTVLDYMRGKLKEDPAFASRVFAIGAADFLLRFLDIFAVNSFDRKLKFPTPPRFFPQYNPIYLGKLGLIDHGLQNHYARVIDAQDNLSTASLFAQQTEQLKELAGLLKALKDPKAIETLVKLHIQELEKDPALDLAQKALTAKSPVIIRHEQSTYKLKAFAIKCWKEREFPSKAQAARQIAPKVQDYAAQHGISPLAPSNAERTIRDWITEHQRTTSTSK